MRTSSQRSQASKHPDSCLIGAAGMRFISRLLAEITDVGQRANVEKARYLRQASHQVKSPLSSIQTYVNVILGGYTGEIPERTRDIVEKIHSRCDAALGALAKRRMLADLRCIDRDGLEMSTVRLGEMIDQAVARYAEAAAGRDIEIRVLPHDGPDLVRCGPPQMLALLCELLENAVIYSHDGGAGGDRPRVAVRRPSRRSPSATTASASRSAASRGSSTRTTGPTPRSSTTRTARAWAWPSPARSPISTGSGSRPRARRGTAACSP